MIGADTDPRGVIAIVTSPDGDVIATVADFDRQSYGGFELWQAQRLRARRDVVREVVRAYSSPALTDRLSSYLLEEIGRALLGERRDKDKHHLVLRSVGWPDDVREEIER